MSEEALALAQKNAQQLEAILDFKYSDVLDHLEGPYDLIVSNPPYISRNDLEEVGANVLASEPHLALFADRDGYAIYEKIAQQTPSVLTPDGKIYLRIGYKQGNKVKLQNWLPYRTKAAKVDWVTAVGNLLNRAS